MVSVLQSIGILYLLLMVYLSFLYYKRNNYSTHSFIFWMCVWSFGIILMIIPESTSFITQKLSVPRVIDFYMILGLMFFSIITFLNYKTVKKNEAKMEELVRAMAINSQNSKNNSKPARKPQKQQKVAR